VVERHGTARYRLARVSESRISLKRDHSGVPGRWWAALYGVCAAVFVVCTLHQKASVNLSATAGGQYPYLIYAEGMAREGVLAHWGDRNRMPLVPALVSAVYHPDWARFADASADLSIVINLLLAAGVGWLIHQLLSATLAVPAVLTWTFVVLLPKASFVQAETPYYALFLVSLCLTVQALRRPGAITGAAAGVAYGLTYLAKASVLPAVAAWWAVALVMAWRAGSARNEPRASARADAPAASEPRASARADAPAPMSTRPAHGETVAFMATPARGPIGGRRQLLSSVVAGAAGFLAVAGFYLYGNQVRFGRPFYNVNGTYYFWCDNWAQAEALSRKYDLERGPPPETAEDVPGPVRYFQRHSAGHAVQRLAYGGGVLLRLAMSHAYGWCILAGVVAALLSRRAQHHGAKSGAGLKTETPRGLKPAARCGRSTADSDWECAVSDPAAASGGASGRGVVAFGTLVAVGYLLAYCWYVPVAYGDRFVLSLALPAMIAALRRADAAARGSADYAEARGSRAADCAVADPTNGSRRYIMVAVLYAVVILASLWSIASVFRRPPETFVWFYFNESRARIDEDRLPIAIAGLEGVVRLDPSFAPAWRELGAARLRSGQPGAAETALRRAIELQPDHVDAHNSLGAALAQQGRGDEAIDAFESAVTLSPDRAETWYNLAALYYQRGDQARCDRALQTLATLDADLAQQLRRRMGAGDD